jgi:hypothetical protein
VTKTAAKPKARILTAKQWREAEAMWESGDFIYDDLVKKFGKSVSTFERHFKKNGIVKGAKAAATKKKVEEKLAAAAVDEAAVMAVRIRETKEEHYKMASALAKLTWNEILKTKQDGVPVAVALNNIKTLHAAMDVLHKARIERWAVLGLDRPDAVDPDELPELVIAELTDEQIKELRDRDDALLEDDTPTHQGDGGSDDDNGVVEEGDD